MSTLNHNNFDLHLGLFVLVMCNSKTKYDTVKADLEGIISITVNEETKEIEFQITDEYLSMLKMIAIVSSLEDEYNLTPSITMFSIANDLQRNAETITLDNTGSENLFGEKIVLV